MIILLVLFMLICTVGYLSIKNTKYSGIRKVLPSILIFFLCLFMVICVLNMVRYQIGFSEFFEGLFSGFN